MVFLNIVPIIYILLFNFLYVKKKQDNFLLFMNFYRYYVHMRGDLKIRMLSSIR